MFEESQFTLTGTGGQTVQFDVRKLLAMEAFELLELLRTELTTLVGVDISDDDDGMQLGMAMIGGISSATVRKAQAHMFPRVNFKSAATREAWAVLAGSEETAFMDLEAAHIYEVTIRAAVVNLKGSWDAIRSRTEAQTLVRRLQQRPT